MKPSQCIGDDILRRARGCLVGQAAGDALGSLVEFHSSEQIARIYPDGVREMDCSPVFNTLPGQPTDDTEMAFALARSILSNGDYRTDWALQSYINWIESHPFDCGTTISSGLNGNPNPHSKANGALMRISPLAIFGAFLPSEKVSQYAKHDAFITHPNEVCQQCNSVYCVGIASAIRHGFSAEDTYKIIFNHAHEIGADSSVIDVIKASREHPPNNFTHQSGYVLLAFQNALYWLLQSNTNLETAVINTIGSGGDTDTNAAICGALLGSVHGLDAIPQRWIDALISCKPSEKDSNVQQPRPRDYWPVDILNLADQLIMLGAEVARKKQ